MSGMGLFSAAHTAFESKLQEYIDNRISQIDTNVDPEVLNNVVTQYFIDHPIEALQVTSEQIADMVIEYFNNNPVDAATEEEIEQAIAAYFQANPLNDPSTGSVPAGYQKTVVDYGADPTGKSDSSEAFQAAVDDPNTQFVLVPNGGQFRIDNTVLFESGTVGHRKSMKGSMFSHFNNWWERGSIFPGSSLTGPMFDGVYIVESVAFTANDNNQAVALKPDGYGCQIIRSSFSGFSKAIQTTPTVNAIFEGNQFTFCGIPVEMNGSSSATITMFVGNLIQHCTDGFVINAEAHGFTFTANTFERVTRYPIRAKSFKDPVFINNWFENTDQENEDGSQVQIVPITTISNQQITDAFSAGNHFQAGYVNTASSSTHAGNIGGVCTDKGDLVVRNQTGVGVRLNSTGLYHEVDDWAGSRDFTIRAGRAVESQKSAVVRYQTHHKGSHIYESLDNAKNVVAFNGYLRYLLDAENTRYLIEKPSNYFGMEGETQKDGYSILTSTPAMIKWRADLKARNTEMFSSTNASNGVLELNSSGNGTFKNPVLNVTVIDEGIELDYIDYIDLYDRPTYNTCNGFRLHFKDGLTPTEVHITLTCFD